MLPGTLRKHVTAAVVFSTLDKVRECGETSQDESFGTRLSLRRGFRPPLGDHSEIGVPSGVVSCPAIPAGNGLCLRVSHRNMEEAADGDP